MASSSATGIDPSALRLAAAMLVAAANESDPAPQVATKTVYLSRVRRPTSQNEPDSSRGVQQRETWQEDEARTQGNAQQKRGRSPLRSPRGRRPPQLPRQAPPAAPKRIPQQPRQPPPASLLRQHRLPQRRVHYKSPARDEASDSRSPSPRRGSPGQEEDRGRSRSMEAPPRQARRRSLKPVGAEAPSSEAPRRQASPMDRRAPPPEAPPRQARLSRSPRPVGAVAKSAGRRPAREQNEGRTSNERAARARTEAAFQERQYQRLDDYYQDTGRPSRSPRRSAPRTPPLAPPLGVQQSIREESPDSSSEPGPLRAVPVLGPERPLNCSDDDQ